MITRIHVKTLPKEREIFGALNFEIISYSGVAYKENLPVMIFLAKVRLDGINTYSTVYCTGSMAIRISQRLKANNLDSSIIDFAIEDAITKPNETLYGKKH